MAIGLLLLTGCRPQEIATLQWAHVDLKSAAPNLPDSKTGEKVVHLSPAAVRLLKRWPQFASSPYVFPGTGRGEKKKGEHIHATTLAHVWADLRTAAKLEDVRLYDACRHSFASVAMSRHGMSLAQIGEQLGHSQPATTQRYAHLHDDVAKQNATAISNNPLNRMAHYSGDSRRVARINAIAVAGSRGVFLDAANISARADTFATGAPVTERYAKGPWIAGAIDRNVPSIGGAL